MNRAHMTHRHTWAGLRVKQALALFLSVLVAASIMASGSVPMPALASPAATLPGRPLAEMLNPDGTLNLGTGFSGTLDVAGWQMAGGWRERPGLCPPPPAMKTGITASTRPV